MMVGVVARWASPLLLLPLLLAVVVDVSAVLSTFPVPNKEREADRHYWLDQGSAEIEERLRLRSNTGRAKRVVLFLGDGMGLPTVTAARIYKGQSTQQSSGEESTLSWDAFPHVSLSRTYGLNVQTSDSANTATAYLCGVKANYETLGVDSRIKVVLGGGRRVFLDKAMKDEEGKAGERTDGKNLIREWIDSKRIEFINASYIWTRQQLLSINPSKTDYLLGLFDNDHIPYVPERSDPDTTKPTLPEMTRVALEILEKSPAGYVLLVEGGRIDHGHHTTRAGLALEEALEFEMAVTETLQQIGTEDSLIVVTADHSHTMSLAGYPTRGKNILGIAGYSDIDKMPYTTLAYANGPNSGKARTNFTEEETTDVFYTQQAVFPKWLETHGGEDVAVYATGPWAHLFSGVHDQTYIPHVMAYAACIGQFSGEMCQVHDQPRNKQVHLGGA